MSSNVNVTRARLIRVPTRPLLGFSLGPKNARVGDGDVTVSQDTRAFAGEAS